MSPSPVSRRKCALSALIAAAAAGCAGAPTRFDPSIEAGFVREPMRHIETSHIELYYPAAYQSVAHHIAARLERCASVLRGKPQPDRSSDRLLVYLTLANFNNAYVQAEAAGAPLQMVLPIHSTLEEDNFLLLGTVNEGNTGCHEATHYVQDQQTHGFWWYANIIGGALVEPSQGLERWFTEGLAVWMEGHIDLKTGRPNSPFWNGMYEAAMTTRGNRPRSGDLDLNTRDLYMTGAYLTSSHFIDYLIRRFGEAKLWQLIDREAGAVVPDIGIALLFKTVYGETLNGLLHDYGDELAAVPMRQRPAAQHVLVPDAGGFARIAVSPADGAIAEISAGYDYPLRLVIRDTAGHIRLNIALTQFLPGRSWVDLSAEGISGMRFSRDGRFLLFVGSSLSVDGDDVSKLYAVETSSGHLAGSWDLTGYGGDLTPDGGYVYVDIQGDTENLVRIDLTSSERTRLTNFEGARSVGSPAVSPDGKRIAFALWNGASFDLALRAEDGTLSMLTQDDRTNYAPRWIDDTHLLFLREWQGHWQAHTYDLTSRAIAPVTDAPYVVLDAEPRGTSEVVFLNRDGVHFTIDSAPLSLSGPAAWTGTQGVAPPSLPFQANPPLQVLSDRPAFGGERWFVPTLHAPFLEILPPAGRGPWEVIAGALVSGSDRLGIHNYSLSVSYDTLTQQPSFSASYILAAFAPSLLSLSVSRGVSVGAENREASLSYDRTFWDVPLHIGVVAQQQILREPAVLQGPLNALLIGPNASVSYNASETTPYGGVRRSLRLSLSGALYDDQLSPQFVGDIRPAAGFTVPLPFWARHSFSLDVVGHLVTGPSTYLAAGGFAPGQTLFLGPPVNAPDNPPTSTPSYALSEYIRGYENFAVYTNRALILSADYRAPIIIDRGWTSFLWVLPSVWVSEIDVEAFGTGAILPNGLMRAVGAAVTLQTVWAQQQPISLMYQFAYRFDDSLPPVHLVSLGF